MRLNVALKSEKMKSGRLSSYFPLFSLNYIVASKSSLSLYFSGFIIYLTFELQPSSLLYKNIKSFLCCSQLPAVEYTSQL